MWISLFHEIPRRNSAVFSVRMTSILAINKSRVQRLSLELICTFKAKTKCFDKSTDFGGSYTESWFEIIMFRMTRTLKFESSYRWHGVQWAVMNSFATCPPNFTANLDTLINGFMFMWWTPGFDSSLYG